MLNSLVAFAFSGLVGWATAPTAPSALESASTASLAGKEGYVVGTFGRSRASGRLTIEFKVHSDGHPLGNFQRIKIDWTVPSNTSGAAKCEHMAEEINRVDPDHPSDPSASPGSFLTATCNNGVLSVTGDNGGQGITEFDITDKSKEHDALGLRFRPQDAPSSSLHPDTPFGNDGTSATPVTNFVMLRFFPGDVATGLPVEPPGPAYVAFGWAGSTALVYTSAGETQAEIMQRLRDALVALGTLAIVAFDDTLVLPYPTDDGTVEWDFTDTGLDPRLSWR